MSLCVVQDFLLHHGYLTTLKALQDGLRHAIDLDLEDLHSHAQSGRGSRAHSSAEPPQLLVPPTATATSSTFKMIASATPSVKLPPHDDSIHSPSDAAIHLFASPQAQLGITKSELKGPGSAQSTGIVGLSESDLASFECRLSKSTASQRHG